MIPDDLRRDLVEALMGVPLVGADDNDKGRTALLGGIPGGAYFTRNPGNARGDVMVLVLQLEESFGKNGEWRLLQLVDNALPTVQGTGLGKQIQMVREELVEFAKGLRPVQVHPAEMAQVHLFDLRQPVMTCVGMLPPKAKASGFVVATSTARLMAHFSDSLKHRGVEFQAWSRDLVTSVGTPLVIDPMHTPVPEALKKTARVKEALTRKHVVWCMYVADAGDAAALWQQLDAAFEKTLDHHLVVVFGMPTAAQVPAGMHALPPPVFTRTDVANWVGDIGRALAWQDAVITRWAGVVLVGYAGDPDDLPIELVYERLELHRGLVTQNRSQNELVQALDDLELFGE